MNVVLSPEQRERLRAQFRAGIGSRPADTPEFRDRVHAIAEKLKDAPAT